MRPSVETPKQLRHRLRLKWKKLAPQYYWGDDVDVRYYLACQLKTLRNWRVLDVGCNVGVLLGEVPDNNLCVGFDLNLEAISIASQHSCKGRFFLVASLLDFPFKDGVFDLCIMANILPGWDYSVEGDPEKQRARVIKECRRVTAADGGEAWVTLVNGDSPVYWHKDKATLNTFKRLVEPFFTIISISFWNPFTTYLFLVPRALLEQLPLGLRRWTYLPTKLLARLPLIDALLTLCAERWRISRGRHFFLRMRPTPGDKCSNMSATGATAPP